LPGEIWVKSHPSRIQAASIRQQPVSISPGSASSAPLDGISSRATIGALAGA